MDLRPPGDQEFFPQYPQAWSRCPKLYIKLLWCILISTSGRAAHGPVACRVVSAIHACCGGSKRESNDIKQRRRDHSCAAPDRRVEVFKGTEGPRTGGADGKPSALPGGIFQG